MQSTHLGEKIEKIERDLLEVKMSLKHSHSKKITLERLVLKINRNIKSDEDPTRLIRSMRERSYGRLRA